MIPLQANEDAKLLHCITQPQAFGLFHSERHREDFMVSFEHMNAAILAVENQATLMMGNEDDSG